MAMKTSGNLSIKGGGPSVGSTGDIEQNISGSTSGSLVTLGQNSVAYTGGTAPQNNAGNIAGANTSTAPYGMREYYGYVEYMPRTVSLYGTGASSNSQDPATRPNGTSPATINISTSTSFSGGGYRTFRHQLEFSVAAYASANYFSGTMLHYISLGVTRVVSGNGNNLIHRNNSYSNIGTGTAFPLTSILQANFGSEAINLGGFYANKPDSWSLKWIPDSVGISSGFVASSSVSDDGGSGGSHTFNDMGVDGSYQNYTYTPSYGFGATNDNRVRFSHLVSTECASTIGHARGWIQLIVNKSGYAPTAIATFRYDSSIQANWSGGICF